VTERAGQTAADSDGGAATAEAVPIPERSGRDDWWVRHYTFTGTAVGLVFVWFSMTPSLLPRGPLFQGLVSGIGGASGYGLGVFAVWLVRFMRSRDSSPPAPRLAWLGLIAVGAVGMAAMVIWFHVWQDRVRDLMGVAHLKWFDYPLAAALSVIVLFAVVEIGQLVGRLIRFLDRQLDRVAPPRVSAVVVVLLLAALSFLGLGPPLPSTNWGDMLSQGLTFIYDGYWWLIYPAGICIILVTVSFNYIGDALRDAFEVRLQRR